MEQMADVGAYYQLPADGGAYDGADAEAVEVSRPRVGRRCTIEGCNKFIQSGGTAHCKSHGGGKRCNEEGCGKSAERGGSDKCKRHGGGKRCSVEGCPTAARSGETLKRAHDACPGEACVFLRPVL
jgi:hypothetical protein